MDYVQNRLSVSLRPNRNRIHLNAVVSSIPHSSLSLQKAGTYQIYVKCDTTLAENQVVVQVDRTARISTRKCSKGTEIIRLFVKQAFLFRTSIGSYCAIFIRIIYTRIQSIAAKSTPE